MNKRLMEQWLVPVAMAVATLSVLLLASLSDAQQFAPPRGAERTSEPEMSPRGERRLVREIKYGDWQKSLLQDSWERHGVPYHHQRHL